MNLFKAFIATAACVFSALLVPGLSHAAYPVLDAVQGLPSPELITVYPDDSDPELFYFVPTSVTLVFQDGKPRLGVQYWGITGADPNGAGAALTFSVKPAFDKPTVDAVAAEVKKAHPNARFAFPTLVSSRMDLILNGQFMPERQNNTSPDVKGGTVDATAAFTVGLNRVGGLAFAQGAAPDSDVLGARYTYTFTGVAKRLYATITIIDKRVYDHFSVSGSTGGWFGAADWAADWQKLVQDGSIKIQILQGGETDTDAYMLEVFKGIVNAKINGEGMFKPVLQPSNIGGGSARSGWGFNISTAWQHLDESKTLVITIDKKKLEEREFSAGLTFPAVCARYPDSFADLRARPESC